VLSKNFESVCQELWFHGDEVFLHYACIVFATARLPILRAKCYSRGDQGILQVPQFGIYLEAGQLQSGSIKLSYE